ncbi:winged helix-turn-helix domain-containing protein [Microbacterium sp. X-17]|uniref:winged helix-turn-helix domain-containing protein n=1 Tax=Microbacterium sp. X-17 TaxID=3144404 RepID=UPI0031F5206D
MSGDYVTIPVWAADAAGPVHPHLRAPDGLEVRGFGIYVGIDESVAHAAGVDVVELVDGVRRALTDIPGTQTFASVVLAPEGTPTAPLDVVRTALAEPSHGDATPTAGIVVDLARHQVSVDGRALQLRYREQALLDHLIRHRGEVLDRPALQAALRAEGVGEVFDRTIDVYLQRIRRRIEPYGDIIRTVRGRGYRVDPHPDLRVIEHASPPRRF